METAYFYTESGSGTFTYNESSDHKWRKENSMLKGVRMLIIGKSTKAVVMCWVLK